MPRYTDGLVVPGEGGRNSPVGRMFIQPLVEDAHGQAARLDDLLGSWFAVIGFRADPAEHLAGAQRDYLTRLGASLVEVTDSRPGRGQHPAAHPGTQVIEDLEGHLRDWFTRHKARFAVIRPDRYVAALADETSLGAAVNQLQILLEPRSTGRLPNHVALVAPGAAGNTSSLGGLRDLILPWSAWPMVRDCLAGRRGQGLMEAGVAGDDRVDAGQAHHAGDRAVGGDCQPQLPAFGQEPPVCPQHGVEPG
jgi:hypothetical protein